MEKKGISEKFFEFYPEIRQTISSYPPIQKLQDLKTWIEKVPLLCVLYSLV